ncbi:integral membrane protein [Ilyonectria robusta]
MSHATPEDSIFGGSDRSSHAPSTASDHSSAVPRRKRRNRLLRGLIRSATVAAGEEFLASRLADDRGKNGHYLTARVPKMAIYGAFVNTPLTTVLLGGLRKMFAGQESNVAKITQILMGMFVKIVHIISMAVIAGARTFSQVEASVKATLFPSLKLIWLTFPLAVAFAQGFLPPNLWPQFFTMVSFALNTFCSYTFKKKRLAALRRRFEATRHKMPWWKINVSMELAAERYLLSFQPVTTVSVASFTHVDMGLALSPFAALAK